MGRVIETSIDIDTTPEQVWSILTEFERAPRN